MTDYDKAGNEIKKESGAEQVSPGVEAKDGGQDGQQGPEGLEGQGSVEASEGEASNQEASESEEVAEETFDAIPEE